jgi:hypothetical protein
VKEAKYVAPMGKIRNAKKAIVGILKKNICLGYIGVYRRIILKRIMYQVEGWISIT